MDFDFLENLDRANLQDAEGRSTIGLALREFLDSLSVAGHSQDLSDVEQDDLIAKLPRLTEDTLADKNDSCPICMTPWLALLAEEEMAIAMDSPAHPLEYCGITKLSQEDQCGHVFCRRDIIKWIEGSHNSCPLCRHPLLKKGDDHDQPTPTAPESDEQRRLQELLTSEPADPSADPATRLRDLLERTRQTLNEAQQGQTQIQALLSALSGQGDGQPVSFIDPGMDMFGARSRSSAADEDRNEFVGMYS